MNKPGVTREDWDGPDHSCLPFLGCLPGGFGVPKVRREKVLYRLTGRTWSRPGSVFYLRTASHRCSSGESEAGYRKFLYRLDVQSWDVQGNPDTSWMVIFQFFLFWFFATNPKDNSSFFHPLAYGLLARQMQLWSVQSKALEVSVTSGWTILGSPGSPLWQFYLRVSIAAFTF